MSNEIEPTLWAIQEKALKSSASSQSPEEQAAINEYQELYQLLEQLPEDQPPSMLAQTVTSTIVKRHRKQYAGKVLIVGLCLFLIVGLVMGVILLIPQSLLFSQISKLIPLPMLSVAIVVVIAINMLIRRNQ